MNDDELKQMNLYEAFTGRDAYKLNLDYLHNDTLSNLLKYSVPDYLH
jgi:hypothetical protein